MVAKTALCLLLCTIAISTILARQVTKIDVNSVGNTEGHSHVHLRRNRRASQVFNISHETAIGPTDGSDTSAWVAEAAKWRAEQLSSLNLNLSLYKVPELQWAQTSYVQPQVMVHERYLFDRSSMTYTVDRFVEDVNTRYGGIDSVLIWHSYPNIGIDDRSQFDMLTSMPGGLAGYAQMVADFAKHNIAVLIPYNPWDQGTAPGPSGESDATRLAAALKATGAKGINGDTMDGMGAEYDEAAMKEGIYVALEPEVGMANFSYLASDVMTWGYWPLITGPQISSYKYLVPEHMVNICERWAINKTSMFQLGVLSGVGAESWENVWGIWNGLTERSAESFRRFGSLMRYAGRVLGLFTSDNWQPFYESLEQSIFASQWQNGDVYGWSVVNWSDRTIDGPLLNISIPPLSNGGRRVYVDLYRGKVIHEDPVDNSATVTTLSSTVNGGEFTVLAALPLPLSSEAQLFMQEMAAMTQVPLLNLNPDWTVLPQTMSEPQVTVTPSTGVEGMVKIPEVNAWPFSVGGVEIEGGNGTTHCTTRNYPPDGNVSSLPNPPPFQSWICAGVDVQYKWEAEAKRFHYQPLDIASFYMDVDLVSNAKYSEFLKVSQYCPQDTTNFLFNWTKPSADCTTWSVPAELANKPVTGVDYDDAANYCKFYSKRLPTEWEWQYAAQGSSGDHRIYPWGNHTCDSCMPPLQTARSIQSIPDIAQYSNGSSPFGVRDTLGLVWQWTTVFTDDHTQRATLRGGTFYSPQGSMWYFPNSRRLDTHGNYLMMAPSMDRAKTLGFRCVGDTQTVVPP